VRYAWCAVRVAAVEVTRHKIFVIARRLSVGRRGDLLSWPLDLPPVECQADCRVASTPSGVLTLLAKTNSNLVLQKSSFNNVEKLAPIDFYLSA
jgi:hypothetical protein